MILHRQHFGGGIAETYPGDFNPLTARAFVRLQTDWTESYFLLEDEFGNRVPLDVFDDQGKMSFAAAVFYDDTIETERKIELLGNCPSAEAGNYFERLCRACGKSDCPGDYTHYE